MSPLEKTAINKQISLNNVLTPLFKVFESYNRGLTSLDFSFHNNGKEGHRQ